VQVLAAVGFQAFKIALLTVVLLALVVQRKNSEVRNTALASTTLNRAVASKETTTIVGRLTSETEGTSVIISAVSINSALSRSAEQTAAAETARTQGEGSDANPSNKASISFLRIQLLATVQVTTFQIVLLRRWVRASAQCTFATSKREGLLALTGNTWTDSVVLERAGVSTWAGILGIAHIRFWRSQSAFLQEWIAEQRS